MAELSVRQLVEMYNIQIDKQQAEIKECQLRIEVYRDLIQETLKEYEKGMVLAEEVPQQKS